MTPTLERPLFLFDADCGVCQNGTDAIRERINPPVDIVASNAVDYQALGITRDDLDEGPVFVTEKGEFVVGPVGMARMLSMSRRPYRYVGRLMLLPGIRHALAALGPAMYRNRYRLPGSTPACEVNR